MYNKELLTAGGPDRWFRELDVTFTRYVQNALRNKG